MIGRLVGRDSELAVLIALLDRAREGRGSVALVHGEPGIGKTSLLEAVADRANDFDVAWGRAWEVSSAPPFWPWIEALRTLVASARETEHAAHLARLMPELDAREPRRTNANAADAFSLYDAVVGFLANASRNKPILILLDDLHATDLSSLRLAEFVVQQLPRHRILLAGSYRDVEARRSPPHETSLDRLTRHGEALALARLDEKGVEELVRARSGKGEAETVRMIYEATSGNPLFVRELLRLLAARGNLANEVPAGARTVIRERLALLSPATVALLEASAIVGREFETAVAAEIAGVTAAALERAVADAIAAELVSPAGSGRHRFSHALVAEALERELDPVVRARLHQQAAEVLEKRHAGDPHAPLGEIARHWTSAGAEHAARAVAAASAAAQSAEARLAFAGASALYEQAIGALAIAAPTDLRRRAELSIRLGQAHVRAGDRERASEACTRAAELAESLGDGELFARAALAYGSDVAFALVDPQLVSLLERALSLLAGGNDSWRAKVAARLAAARQPARDPNGPIALAREAIAMARGIDDRSVLLEVLFSAGGALVDYAPPAERAALAREAAELAALAGDRLRQLRSLQRLAFDYVDLGDVGGFERTVEAYESVTRGPESARYQWVPMMFRAMRAAWEGRFDDDERLQREAIEHRARHGEDGAILGAFRRQVIRAHRFGGEEVDRAVEMYLGNKRAMSAEYAYLIRAWGNAISGRAAETRRELDAIPEVVSSLNLRSAEFLAEIAWALRDRPLAARVAEHLAQHAGRPFMVTAIGFVVTGLVDHARMRMAAVLERWDEAALHGESALAFARRLGAWPLIERIERELAAMQREPAPPAAKPGEAVRTTLEGEFWTVEGLGELCRIKDSRGMQMIARLIASPGVEAHSLDLAGAELADGGDSGEVLDRDARAAYQSRLRELGRELEEASSWNDVGRREKLEQEIDFITSELSGAFGLGGRERRTGSAAERARSNVRRRIADALRRITEGAPRLGKYLERTIKTGVLCSYDPDR